jgi:hypothetical protein
MKEKNRRFPQQIITYVFGEHANHHLTLTALLQTASVSLPIPLSAANGLSRSKLYIQRLRDMKLTMKFEMGATDCPQLTPANALSVVPIMFGYNAIKQTIIRLSPTSWCALPLRLIFFCSNTVNLCVP